MIQMKKSEVRWLEKREANEGIVADGKESGNQLSYLSSIFVDQDYSIYA